MQMDPHGHDDHGVDRHDDALDPRGQDVGHAVAAQRRHVAAAEPGEARGVEAGGQGAGVPGAVLVAPAPAPGADEQGVAGAHPQAGPLLGGLEVLGEDGLAGLERVDAAQRRDVEQHAPGHDAGVEVVDAQPGGAVGGHRLRRVPVVEPPLVEDVAQGVEVAGGEAVGREGEVVGAPSPR